MALVLAVTASVMASCSSDEPSQDGGTISGQYAMGVRGGGTHRALDDAIIQALNGELDGANFTGVPTNGTLEVFQRIGQGELNFGPWTADVGFKAANGLEEFKDRSLTVSPLFVYSVSEVSILIRKDAGIDSLRDLDGKPFAAGERGTTTETMIKRALDQLGVQPDYFTGSLEDIVDAFKDRRVVGYAKTGRGFGLDATAQEFQASGDVTVLGFTEAELQGWRAQFPYYTYVEVPEGALFAGSPRHFSPSVVVGFGASTDSLSEAAGAAVLRTIVDHQADLAAVFSGLTGKDIIQVTFDNANMPLHPGAVKYLRDRGVDVPAELVP